MLQLYATVSREMRRFWTATAPLLLKEGYITDGLTEDLIVFTRAISSPCSRAHIGVGRKHKRTRHASRSLRSLLLTYTHFYFTLSRIHHRGVTHLHVVCGAATQHTTCERRAALMIMLGHTRSSSHSFDGVVVMISLALTTVIESRGGSSSTGAARGLEIR